MLSSVDNYRVFEIKEQGGEGFLFEISGRFPEWTYNRTVPLSVPKRARPRSAEALAGEPTWSHLHQASQGPGVRVFHRTPV